MQKPKINRVDPFILYMNIDLEFEDQLLDAWTREIYNNPSCLKPQYATSAHCEFMSMDLQCATSVHSEHVHGQLVRPRSYRIWWS